MTRRRVRGVHTRRGFTLIEASLTMIIIGVGVIAMVEAQQAFLVSNAWSSQSATGSFLANEIREMTRFMPRHDPVTGLSLGDEGLSGWGPETGEVVIWDYDDLDDFDGLILTWNGTPGRGDGDLPGPISAFGDVIPQMDADGNVVTDDEGNELAMEGWSQRITVEKVEPYDTGTTRDDDYEDATFGVADFPLRVTVTVWYQGPWEVEALEVSRLSWIAP